MKITCMIVKGEVSENIGGTWKKAPILAKHDLSVDQSLAFLYTCK